MRNGRQTLAIPPAFTDDRKHPMAAEDELRLPEVPEAKPEDPEDVSWALSTAEAMWARGDHLEGIKWVRKAARPHPTPRTTCARSSSAKAASE